LILDQPLIGVNNPYIAACSLTEILIMICLNWCWH